MNEQNTKMGFCAGDRVIAKKSVQGMKRGQVYHVVSTGYEVVEEVSYCEVPSVTLSTWPAPNPQKFVVRSAPLHVRIAKGWAELRQI